MSSPLRRSSGTVPVPGARSGGPGAAGAAGAAGPVDPVDAVVSGTTVHFTQAARLLAREARRAGLVAPGFRCPPRVVGVQRSIRRHQSGAVVAVQVRGRPWGAVVADMIEGVVVANRLAPPAADRLRTDLWTAIGVEWPSDLPRVA